MPRTPGNGYWRAALSTSGTVSSARIAATGLEVYDPSLIVGVADVIIAGRVRGMGTIEGSAVARTTSFDAFVSRSPR